MHKRMPTLIGATLLLLAACSGTTPTDEVLPTLAKLPTNAPTSTVVPVTATALASPVPGDVTAQPPASPSAATSPEATAGTTDEPSEPTPTFLPAPEGPQPSIFPTLVDGMGTTLQGQLTVVDETHALLTDSQGATVIVLIDPLVAQNGANQSVQISGTVETEGTKLVLRMTDMTILSESTPEATASP